ncbi:MAG: riboflavin synthase [Candidatus Dadabacteria bacterium]|nr:riboflavin synthase [Candidatus Dadabacteria bacterium]
MFTGIIEDVGTVDGLKPKTKEVLLRIRTKNIDVNEIKIGESISVNGACLTVISVKNNTFTVEASHETLRRTTLFKLKLGSRVNLERSLKLGDRLGGHIVNGHVDGVGKVESVNRRGKSLVFWFSILKGHSRYIVEKGSIAVDGVSLTINEVNGEKFSVNIIPYTQEATIFGPLKTGDSVNLEFDIIGKYVEKFLVGVQRKKDISELIKKF